MEELKKLQFKKEQIVSLNDSDLNQVHGGVAASDPVDLAISIASVITAITTLVMETIDYFERHENDQPEFSKVYVDLDNGKACLLDEVVVHSIKTA
jgi:hypothetical protein